MHESFQECGISQKPAQSFLQNFHVLQCPLKQEVAEKLGGSGVAEEGEVEGASIAEEYM